MRDGSEEKFEDALERVGSRVKDGREVAYEDVKEVDGGNDAVNEGNEDKTVDESTSRVIVSGMGPLGEGSLGLGGMRAILIPLLGPSLGGNIWTWTSSDNKLKRSLLARRRSARGRFVPLIREPGAILLSTLSIPTPSVFRSRERVRGRLASAPPLGLLVATRTSNRLPPSYKFPDPAVVR